MYTIITRNQCSFCDTAKALLKGAGISYVEYNIETDSSRWILTLMKKTDLKTVPQIFSSDVTHIGGYTDLREFLDIIDGVPV
jgi:glutaredoxin 3